MGAFFDRASLLAAFDAIGTAARDNGTRLELAIYDGAALMRASNFRFATEDVDIAEIGTPWPDWLRGIVREIARWAPDWPPRWIGDHARYLSQPWFPHVGEDPGLREYLTFASPAEFKSRNVVVDVEPLRRANMPRR